MPTLVARAIGKRQPLVPDWEIPYPPDLRPDGERITLRDLIARIVRDEVRAFKERQQQRRLIRVLTAREIEEGVARGKVDAGGHDLDQRVDEDEAVGAALQAFVDGLYLVVVDEKEERALDAEVYLKPDSKLVFLRVVALAGG